MSVTNPKNREELKQYILTRLGAPVLQVNIADEQLDIAINDAFAYYFGRSHYNGTERVYLSTRIEQPFLDFWKTKTLTTVDQKGEPKVYADGMVDTVTLTAAGSGYPTGLQAPTQLDIATTTAGAGDGLTLDLGSVRTSAGGLSTATVNKTGKGYVVGDVITVVGGDNNATYEVATIKTESPVLGKVTFEQQNNYILLPENVLSVAGVMKKSGHGGMGMMGGLGGAGLLNPFIMGGAGGSGACGNMMFDMTTYYTMKQYLALLDFMLFPPISYNFNQRLHRLYINSDNFNGIGVNDYLMFEVTTYPTPELYPEMWSDFWLKEYVVLLAKYQWGLNLSKYQNVQLPGGITMNGDSIKNEAQQELQRMRDRFAMDAADPPLDLVG